MTPTEIFIQLSHWIGNLYLKSYTFCLYFILFLYVWIRIDKGPEYGSNTDPDTVPDPQNWKNKQIFCLTLDYNRLVTTWCWMSSSMFYLSLCSLLCRLLLTIKTWCWSSCSTCRSAPCCAACSWPSRLDADVHVLPVAVLLAVPPAPDHGVQLLLECVRDLAPGGAALPATHLVHAVHLINGGTTFKPVFSLLCYCSLKLKTPSSSALLCRF